jgi:hypothetical protein|tara:strand:+ start:632 stop:1318 length:687 start_codon:yes stop_codon:yes gene_type:complete
MSYLISNIPHFKCWVRKEFTTNHQHGHGEYLHALAIAVNTIPDRSLSFQVVFTGCEAEDDESNIHGGAMWARMPIQALVADIPVAEWALPMEDHLAQPWDCEARNHSVIVMDRVSSSPWICKINNNFYKGKYLFTVDYTDNSIADCPAQHKQSHVIYITEDCEWKGNIVALPNNRVRATSPALWVTGEGPPDFAPSQHIHSAEGHESYLDPLTTFNNLYSEGPETDET